MATANGPPKSIPRATQLAMAAYAKKITFDYHCTRFLEQAVEVEVSIQSFSAISSHLTNSIFLIGTTIGSCLG